MKKKSIIIIAIVSIIVLAMTVQSVFADNAITVEDLLGNSINSSDNNTSKGNSISGTNTNTNVNTNTNTNVNTNTKNNTNSNANNTLAKAGIESNAGVIIAVVCVISAIYALKKINEYKTK